MEAKSPDRATVVPRVEDDVLLRGQGRYIADARWPNQAYACFVRSPHACARIAGVNAAAAREAPGIVGVLTGSDAAELGSIGRASTARRPRRQAADHAAPAGARRDAGHACR